jgi:hypothetical protein
MTAKVCISRGASLPNRNYSGNAACSSPEKTGPSGERDNGRLLPADPDERHTHFGLEVQTL